MILFFTAGVVMTIAVRFFVARICAFVVASGMIKPIRVGLIGVNDDTESGDAVATLEAQGYSVVSRFFLPLDDEWLAGDPDGAESGRHRRLREITRLLRNRQVDEIFIAIPWHHQSLIEEIESELRALPLPVKLVPDNVTERLLRRPVLDLGQTKAVELQRAPLSGTQRKLKRAMDQVLAVLGLIVLFPLLVIVAIAVRLESPGPALFLQTRVGFNGRPFKIYKFRTMTTQDDGAVIRQATRNDARVTRLGALLRRFSIDEIPQLINVVRGDMSLVGPRPHALAHDNEYDDLIATYAIRHKIKPGITGWAQVNGCRGETPEIGMMKQRVENDIWYIEYWSLWLDIRILLLTIVRMAKSDDAAY